MQNSDINNKNRAKCTKPISESASLEQKWKQILFHKWSAWSATPWLALDCYCTREQFAKTLEPADKRANLRSDCFSLERRRHLKRTHKEPQSTAPPQCFRQTAKVAGNVTVPAVRLAKSRRNRKVSVHKPGLLRLSFRVSFLPSKYSVLS
ncbi:hypothetical protein RRG08_040988 [Elysia crispata]|uniref:Uncharacterized protein n=1 Tax=Elysia crispata TaxID=231223 RepID=A0AAE0ZJU2_9GAST|nr:hypothetical protein RRG08_040988 [Elysia crispata]